MELLMESFPSGDASPWSVDSNTVNVLQGRGYFSLLGHVRRKPARADAERSDSKSCSDKLAVKQVTSILSYPADLFVEKTPNAYIKRFVVYADQFNPVSYQRAFGREGRLSPLKDAGVFFTIEPLRPDFARFAFERRKQSSAGSIQVKSKTSNISALWVLAVGTLRSTVVEVLINGVKQGYKQWDARSAKASIVSRRELWITGLRILRLLENLDIPNIPGGEPRQGNISWFKMIRSTLSASTYDEAKSSAPRHSHNKCKKHVTDILDNWTKNTGDSNWSWSHPDWLTHLDPDRECSLKTSQSLFKSGNQG
ncbi:hypothetical protein AYL99_07154 [Fonsecaea erecta]|uniref:A to I editase domain-containing protein n=1 Tax=Fonsecaea erecta TaxID=1367422 RepID=A0A178ZE30_9EURO|nr:hypothetical protein AYL99_07154 [Fonsecaea erecta]OAP58064.1 hypothetical protein AYL99_07154 [Fonsecaea erecta]